jgi:esterase/lipase
MTNSEKMPHKDEENTPITSKHDVYQDTVENAQHGNQIFVIVKMLEQLQTSLPDKATIQSTFSLITQMLPALANVASKENLLDMSRRIGYIETAVGQIRNLSELSDKDIQSLKEGQKLIAESSKSETSRLEKMADDNKRDINRQIQDTSSEIKAIRTSVDGLETSLSEIKNLSALGDKDIQSVKEGQKVIGESLKTETSRLEKMADDRKRDLEKQADDRKRDLEKQIQDTASEVKAIRTSVDSLAKEIGNVKSENSRYLLSTILGIIAICLTVSSVFIKPFLDKMWNNFSTQPVSHSATQLSPSTQAQPASSSSPTNP